MQLEIRQAGVQPLGLLTPSLELFPSCELALPTNRETAVRARWGVPLNCQLPSSYLATLPLAYKTKALRSKQHTFFTKEFAIESFE